MSYYRKFFKHIRKYFPKFWDFSNSLDFTIQYIPFWNKEQQSKDYILKVYLRLILEAKTLIVSNWKSEIYLRYFDDTSHFSNNNCEHRIEHEATNCAYQCNTSEKFWLWNWSKKFLELKNWNIEPIFFQKLSERIF